MPGVGYGVSAFGGPTESGDRYCTVDDVKSYLPTNIIAEGDGGGTNYLDRKPETITNLDIEFYIDQACQRIDAALSSIFDVPLKKVNQGGRIHFPYPINVIAAILTSQIIFEQRLQGVDSARSESQKEREHWAESELTLLQNGERRLIGQRTTRASRFVRNTLYNTPKNPAKGGSSKGGGN